MTREPRTRLFPLLPQLRGVHFARFARTFAVVAAAASAGMSSFADAPVALPDTMHQEILKAPEPDGRRSLAINPPTFRWPTFGAAPYTVEVGRSETLAEAVRHAPAKETFFRPLAPLAPGRYWWRVTDAKGERTSTVSFEVGNDVARWPVPAWSEALARVPDGRPRLLMRPEDLPRLREAARGPLAGTIGRWAAQAAGRIGRPFERDEEPYRQKTIPDEQGRQFRRKSMAKDFAAQLAGGMDRLCLLYLMTGDARYRDEIRRRALAAVEIDPHGLTAHASSDFANETLVLGLAWSYDTLHDEWSSAERERIREALMTRLRQAFARFIPNSEQQIYGAHEWQHVVKSMTLGALALFHESPEARSWFEWSFKAHVSLYPWYGGADGGSAEGLGYHRGHNARPSLEASAMFEAATGVSLFGNPWYRNTPYFLLYGAGLGNANSQQGDMSSGGSAGERERALIRLFAARLDDPHLAAYAAAIGGERAAKDGDDLLELLWHPLELPAPAPLADLPKARVFSDVGVVFMRSALTDPVNDIFFEMRSSPYGNYVHAHADQNAFNVTAFGERLVVDSGYYYTYGDEHHRGWTKTTQAHNTILVGGAGQGHTKGKGDLSAYGQIADYEAGEGFVRVTGSAPRAYNDKAVTRFDRHVLWLQPDTYLIADDLATETPETFQWLLHAQRKMEVDGAVVRIASGRAAARLRFFAPAKLAFEQTDTFAVPVTFWNKERQNPADYPNQWHLTASTAQPATTQRFVSVMQVHRAGEEAALPEASVVHDDEGVELALSDGRRGRIRWR